MDYTAESVGAKDKILEEKCGEENKKPSAILSPLKKKQRKWLLSGLFKKRRNKSSDTDCSSDSSDCKKGGFLVRRKSVRKKNGGSHRVIGKFESVRIPKSENITISDSILDNLEKYETSPNVMQRRISNIYNVPVCVSQSNQEMSVSRVDPEMSVNSTESLDMSASKVNDKQKLKARVEALRGRLCDDSSSEEYGSSKNSNSSSLQRLKSSEDSSGKANSLGKKSRAARTDRYIKRHFRDLEDSKTYEKNDRFSANPKNIKIGRQNIVCNSKPFNSASSSPLNSPHSKYKSFLIHQTSSLPSKSEVPLNHSPEILNLKLENRSSSWPDNDALKCNLSNEINIKAFQKRNKRRSSYTKDKKVSSHQVPLPVSQRGKVPFTENSHFQNVQCFYAFDSNLGNSDSLQIESRCNDGDYGKICRQQNCAQFGNQPTAASVENSRNKYSTDISPRSRNPIQIIPGRTVRENEKEYKNDERCSVFDSLNFESNNNVDYEDIFDPDECADVCPLSVCPLNTINHLGIPDVDFYKANEYGRPLSMVLEKSEGEQPSSYSESGGDPSNENHRASESFGEENKKYKPFKKPSSKSKSNLEEALRELEEIYDSLRLSDEELLERADRRDISEALQRNLSRCRYSWSDLNGCGNESLCHHKQGSASLECLYYDDSGHKFPIRFSNTRRSDVPDRVKDDMAYRKLNKLIQDPKSTSNIVSQSGSFLLISPTLSPPLLKNIPASLVSPISSPSPQKNIQPIISIPKEPDITYDDVVFRNIRQANNALKINDPQPPFGIPLGPVTPAAESDYLHATPKNNYRSSFRPRRTPDIVTDDLAYRTLRKDIPSYNCRCKINCKRNVNSKKKYSSHSASMGCIVNKFCEIDDRDADESSGGRLDYIKGHMPDILSQFNSNTNGNMSNKPGPDVTFISPDAFSCFPKDEKELSLLADEAKLVSKELKQKLRELEAIPTRKKLLDNSMDNRDIRHYEVASKPNNDHCKIISKADECQCSNTSKPDEHRSFCSPSQSPEKEIFIGKIVHHKPITLSQFKIPGSDVVDKERICNTSDLQSEEVRKNNENQNIVDSDDSSSNYIKEVCETGSRLSALYIYPQINENGFQNRDKDVQLPINLKKTENKDFSLKSICDSFNWDNIKLVCTPGYTNDLFAGVKDDNNNHKCSNKSTFVDESNKKGNLLPAYDIRSEVDKNYNAKCEKVLEKSVQVLNPRESTCRIVSMIEKQPKLKAREYLLRSMDNDNSRIRLNTFLDSNNSNQDASVFTQDIGDRSLVASAGM